MASAGKIHVGNVSDTDQFEGLIQGLLDKGYGCCDDFLDTLTIADLRQHLHDQYASGQMSHAGIGNKNVHQKNERVRGDMIRWIDNESVEACEQVLYTKIMAFISYLNETCYTSIDNFESHYAHYAINSFYKRHLDQFKSAQERKYSIILYLNDDWQGEDGGILMLYPKGAPPLPISPLGGRLIFFKSDDMEHEVLPSTTRIRMSIAGWLKIKDHMAYNNLQ